MIDFKFKRGDRVKAECKSGWTFEGRIRNRRLNLIGQKVYDIDWWEDGHIWTMMGVTEKEITKL